MGQVIEREVVKLMGDDPPKARLLYGQDVRKSLRLIEPHTVQMVATSPPYWGLRDYGGEPGVWGGNPDCDHEWGDVGPAHHHGQVEQTKWKSAEGAGKGGNAGSGQFCKHCGAWLGQLGLEPTPRLFAQHVVEVFEGIRRVLRKDGVVFLNLGDTYFGSSTSSSKHKNFGKDMVAEGRWPKDKSVGGTNPNHKNTAWKAAKEHPSAFDNLKPKDLVGIPWRVALALQDAGWYLRNDIIWAKGNCMPESVRDRCTRSHEYIFLFAHPDCGGDYFFDTHAIREPCSEESVKNLLGRTVLDNKTDHGGSRPDMGNKPRTAYVRPDHTRNKRTVWNVNPKGYPGAHFAVWPEALVEPLVKAGSSQHGCCSKCRAPYKRQLEVTGKAKAQWGTRSQEGLDARLATASGGVKNGMGQFVQIKQTKGWEPTCDCPDHEVIPCLVMDTFSGSATTGVVAWKHGRDYVGTDLQPDYLDLAVARLEGRKAPAKGPKKDNSPDLIGDLFG